MIISLNWLKKFVEIDMPVDELATLIGSRLVEVEGVEYIGDKYKNVIISKVVKAEKLEGSDHLNIVHIDDGGKVEGVDRLDNGLVQVVCGAPNVTEGSFVAWLPPASVVPETFNDEEPFILSARPLRGVISNGMLASAKELDLYDDHTGILIIDKKVEPGDSFRDVYELDDYIFDIENKSLTHRPDAFGLVGFAREIAGIQGRPFDTPEWLTSADGSNLTNSDQSVRVGIEDPSLSESLSAVVIDGIDNSVASSVQVQAYLSRSGVRPISYLVDLTNYLMLVTGQPLHAYDYDKFLSASDGVNSLNVRSARNGEKLDLIDGREIELDESDIVIAAGDTAVGLAGAMGGSSTEVDSSTKRVLLEAATFNLYKLRSTQMRHGIYSEAITRFTKGVPANTGPYVITEFVNTVKGAFSDISVGNISTVNALASTEPKDVTVQMDLAAVNDTLGSTYSAEDIVTVLENVGFSVEISDSVLAVTVPYWRKDISIAEDVIEEVGRLLGFDNINFTLPKRSSVAVTPEPFDSFRSKIRSSLASAGANEVFSYSFIHEDFLRKTGLNPDNSYKIVNSISPDLQRYRQSLTPSLLSLVHPNIKSGFDSFSLFELNKVHAKDSGLTSEGVPVEHDMLSLVVAIKNELNPYYNAKRYLDYLATALGVKFNYKSLAEWDSSSHLSVPFEPARSAVVTDTSGSLIGFVGEYKNSVKKSWKLSDGIAGFELDLNSLMLSVEQSKTSRYSSLSRYPGSERDICFQVLNDVSYSSLIVSAESVLYSSDYIWSISPVDIYKPQGADTKNVTIRISLASYSKTLTSEEVSGVCDLVIEKVIGDNGGKVV